jgi:hypothetical protein
MTKKIRKDIIFAKIGDMRYIAATEDLVYGYMSLNEAINIMFPGLSKEKVTIVDEQEIPETYKWSIKRVKQFRNWEKTGTYLLIENFENYSMFSFYFPSEQPKPTSSRGSGLSSPA